MSSEPPVSSQSIGAGTVYVLVRDEKDPISEAMRIPTYSDKSLGLNTLRSAYPNARGLKFRNPVTNDWHTVLTEGTEPQLKFLQPDGGWSNRNFIVTYHEPEYVLISHEEDPSSVSLRIPTASDKSLALYTLTSAFPNSCGLKFKEKESKEWHTLLMDESGTKFIAPPGGWSGRKFVVIHQPPVQSVRAEVIPGRSLKRARTVPPTISLESRQMNEIYEFMLNNPDWCENIKRYMYYFLRDGKESEKRCVCAISTKFAITYAHGKNELLRVRTWPRGDEASSSADNQGQRGDEVKIFSVVTREEVLTEVVFKDVWRDFIILEAHDKDLTPKETILEKPKLGEWALAVGFSTESKDIQPTVFHGTISCLEQDDRKQMISSHIVWGGDSGAGLFDCKGRVVGMVSASLESSDREYTRTSFVPSSEIEPVLNCLIKPLPLRRRAPKVEE